MRYCPSSSTSASVSSADPTTIALRPLPEFAIPPHLRNRRLLRLLRAIFTPRVRAIRHTAQIQRAPHKLIPHSGTVLRAAAADQHDAVLLDVVSLARDVRGDGGAGGEAHTRRLALARVGLLGFDDADLDADAFALWVFALREGGGDGVAWAADFAAALMREVVRCYSSRLEGREGRGDVLLAPA